VVKKLENPFLDKLMFLPNTLDKEAEKIAPMLKYADGGRIGFEQGEGSMDPDTMALKEKIEEIMDIEGVGFGEAFKQAMRELASQSKGIMVKRLTTTVPPASGPQSQGLNISYNTVKEVKHTEKINGRRQYRQGSSKRAKKRI
jgi:hypothetical protein